MVELQHCGFYPLDEDSLVRIVPSRAGVYLLAVRLANGVLQTFYTGECDNLYRTLRAYFQSDPGKTPEIVLDHTRRYQCYFTFFTIPQAMYREEIVKLLSQTSDPVLKLQILETNV